MYFSHYSALCIIITSFIHQCCSQTVKLSSIETAYKKGVKAYSDESWSECIAQFEDALHLYKVYKSVLVNCRSKCNSIKYDPVINLNIEDFQYYEKLFQIRNCLNSCNSIMFSDLNINSEVDYSVALDMSNRMCYDYLQVCYFQMNALQKAASAAYTFLKGNPNDVQMKNNLQYYIDQPEVDPNEIVDLESEDFEVLYKLGKKSYEKKNWAETIAAIEEVISNYITWENHCRTECQQQPDQDASHEFVIKISNNVAALLNCRQHCQNRAKQHDFHSGGEFLAHMLNFLQISYYNMERYDDAAKCVASYLMIIPYDEDMLINKEFYTSLVKESAFQIRQDIEYYMKRDTNEKYLLDLFHEYENNISDT